MDKINECNNSTPLKVGIETKMESSEVIPR